MHEIVTDIQQVLSWSGCAHHSDGHTEFDQTLQLGVQGGAGAGGLRRDLRRVPPSPPALHNQPARQGPLAPQATPRAA